LSAEQQRLEEDKERKVFWKRWGPYVSERAWGTVREDYSADGEAWAYLPFDQARSKTYRWNEDGLGGFCDRHQRICIAFAFWNGKDPILKERLFGLGGPEGNHGEDVKEYYFYLDSTPTHSYCKFLYKYPQAEFPYRQLREVNRERTKEDPEFELMDTGVFDEDRYFDITIEYAKIDAEDICARVTIENRGPDAAPIHVLPTIWFRNRWSWDRDSVRPLLQAEKAGDGMFALHLHEELRGDRYFYCAGARNILYTENDTNFARLYPGAENKSRHVKDAFDDFVIHDDKNAVNAEPRGTKAAAVYQFDIPAGDSKTVYLRFTDEKLKIGRDEFLKTAEDTFEKRIAEADEFYAGIIPKELSDDGRSVMRQALAGMLWSKQFYHYVVKRWLDGDPAFGPPPAERLKSRNCEWKHLYNEDVISMPDKWEYPWYAAWDLAFHCLTLSIIDSEFAKEQLILMLREWYMHPNGQIPAYEWKFSDVNPPVHAWAALRIYRIEGKRTGNYDFAFLEKIFHKLLLNFTWWVNRKDPEGNNVFEGGFLGMDNIGVFDRSSKLPTGGYLEQSDGTGWMAMFSLNMLAVALELAKQDKAYEDVASKFFEHFVQIADAMNKIGKDDVELWNDEDGFFYDVLHVDGENLQLKVRSMVGLLPLFAVETMEEEWLKDLPGFKTRMDWFLHNRPDLTDKCANMELPGRNDRRLLAIVNRERLVRVLNVMLNEGEFLSGHGIRALSRIHLENPYVFPFDGIDYSVTYEPGESRSGLFGGNSNWRGPVWFPANYLLIEALQKFHYYYGDDLKVEFPSGSGNQLNLWEVSQELSRRLSSIFLQDENGRRAVYGNNERFQMDPNWRDHVLFFEYFNGDDGTGLGASHQTGWTGLVAKLLQQSGE
jgi:hypothetical protein